MNFNEMDNEKERLDIVSANHCYEDGFNGQMSTWRLEALRDVAIPEGWGEGKIGHSLEIGAGCGRMTPHFSRWSDSLTSLEPSDSYFRTLEKECLWLRDTTLLNTLFEDFHPDGEFDSIFACGILEHVKYPRQFIRKVCDLLRVGGRAYFIVPNAESIHRRVGVSKGMLTHSQELAMLDFKVGHRRYYTARSLEEDIKYFTDPEEITISDRVGILLKPYPNHIMNVVDADNVRMLVTAAKTVPISMCAELLFVVTKNG